MCYIIIFKYKSREIIIFEKRVMKYLLLILWVVIMTACSERTIKMKKVIFLHHSTGYNVWTGKTNRYLYKLTGKGDVQKYISRYNKKHSTNYQISDQFYPKKEPYGWKNYPFDYYNLWVKNAGATPYMDEATLEILTTDYDLIIFKHCFPVSRIQLDSGAPDIDSDIKSLQNYKLQYLALKEKIHTFPDNKFIVWTPAVNTQKLMSEEEAIRTKQFRDWVVNEWDQKGDNIFVWDFYSYETEGGLYLADKNSVSPDNSHPNVQFSGRIAPFFGQFIIDVIESRVD